MALPKSGIRIPRRSIAGMEGMWTKMWDPPRESPTTPDFVAPTNPVPAFMGQVLGIAPQAHYGPASAPARADPRHLGRAQAPLFMAFDDGISPRTRPGRDRLSASRGGWFSTAKPRERAPRRTPFTGMA